MFENAKYSHGYGFRVFEVFVIVGTTALVETGALEERLVENSDCGFDNKKRLDWGENRE